MNQIIPVYEEKRYYAIALDPIHVGTGGYRLGRVDLSIIREPATNLPKIPGSSIAGVARAFTAMRNDKYRVQRQVPAGEGRLVQKITSCAGKGGQNGEQHCCEADCPVCVSFGFSNGANNKSLQGMAQFFDAQILFFPVYSMLGPVWLTSPLVFQHLNIPIPPSLNLGESQIKVSQKLRIDPTQPMSRLNLGWLMLEVSEELSPEILQDIKLELIHLDPTNSPIDEIIARLVVVSNDLYSQIVNNNMEIRTSVAIDPATGAAEDKALFTYEALPRATVLAFDVAYNNPTHFQIDGNTINHDINWVKEHVQSGLELFEHLGVGGMNTRGMGRLKILNLN